jgi:hypothetical protein
MASRSSLDAGLAPARASAPAPITIGPEDTPDIQRIRTITRWLDDRYLDPILGFLLPGFGDVLPLTFGLYVLITAARRHVPPVVLARMILNVAIDALVGAVPVLGDLFDVVFKAHRRNADLLMQRHGQSRGTAGDWLLVIGALLFLLAVLVVPIVLLIWAASGIRDLIVS